MRYITVHRDQALETDRQCILCVEDVPVSVPGLRVNTLSAPKSYLTDMKAFICWRCGNQVASAMSYEGNHRI